MNIRELEDWLIELANLNIKNKRLNEEIDNLQLLLMAPFRHDIISELEVGLNNIIEIAYPYLPKESLLVLPTKKENFEEVIYPGKVTAGMMLENCRKDRWKAEILKERPITDLKEAIENHKAKLNSIFSRYNPFLRSPEAKIRALEMLEDYLNRPNALAPDAQSIHELIEAWKEASLPPEDKSRDESPGANSAEIIGRHRNLFHFFYQPHNLKTSTQDFIDSVDRIYGNSQVTNGLQ